MNSRKGREKGKYWTEIWDESWWSVQIQSRGRGARGRFCFDLFSFVRSLARGGIPVRFDVRLVFTNLFLELLLGSLKT